MQLQIKYTNSVRKGVLYPVCETPQTNKSEARTQNKAQTGPPTTDIDSHAPII